MPVLSSMIIFLPKSNMRHGFLTSVPSHPFWSPSKTKPEKRNKEKSSCVHVLRPLTGTAVSNRARTGAKIGPRRHRKDPTDRPRIQKIQISRAISISNTKTASFDLGSFRAPNYKMSTKKRTRTRVFNLTHVIWVRCCANDTLNVKELGMLWL